MRNILIGKKKHEYYNDLLIRADRGLHQQIAKRVGIALPDGGRILDFGAGQGALSERLADLGYQVVAVDKDPSDFHSKRIPFVQVDFADPDQVSSFISEHRASFDLVLSVEVIEHIEDPYSYIRSITRLVKPNGYILATTPNTTSWLSRMRFLLHGRFESFFDEDLIQSGHINPLTPWELGVIMQRCGIEMVSMESGGTLPAVWISWAFKRTLLNLAFLCVRPFAKGFVDGWCLICLGRVRS